MEQNAQVFSNRVINPYFSEDHIHRQLDLIQEKLDEEIAAKQKTIERREEEILRLNALLQEREAAVNQLTTKLADCNRHAEGNRQLINKLLNDIERLQQDLEWYKRTFEKRSLLGTLKQKIFNR